MHELLCKLAHAYVTNDHSQTTVDEIRELLLDLETAPEAEPVPDADSEDDPATLFGGDHS